MPEKLDKAGTWQWLSKSYLKIGKETLLCVAQEQTIRRNYLRRHMIRPVKALYADYVEKKVKVYNT